MLIESEKLIERKLNRAVEALGGWSIKLLSTYIRGLPDRLCLMPGGRLFFVEVKTTKKKATKIQKGVHKKLRSLGFRVEVIDSSEGIRNLMRDYG